MTSLTKMIYMRSYYDCYLHEKKHVKINKPITIATPGEVVEHGENK